MLFRSEGALAVLRQQADVMGSLADRIRVPSEHVPAVEAVLGHQLQVILTERPEAAERILGELRAGKKGRASIAALGMAGSDPNGETPAPEPPVEGAVPVLSVVSADESVLPLLRGWLGRTWIVQDLAAATAGHRASGGRADFVTATGDLLTRHGVFTGGAAGNSGKAAASILGRKNQIAELQSELTALQARAEEAGQIGRAHV